MFTIKYIYGIFSNYLSLKSMELFKCYIHLISNIFTIDKIGKQSLYSRLVVRHTHLFSLGSI